VDHTNSLEKDPGRLNVLYKKDDSRISGEERNFRYLENHIGEPQRKDSTFICHNKGSIDDKKAIGIRGE